MLSEQYVTASELAERLGVAMTHLYWLASAARYLPTSGWGSSGFTVGPKRMPSRSGTDTTVRQGRAWRGSRTGTGSPRGNDPVKPASQPGQCWMLKTQPETRADNELGIETDEQRTDGRASHLPGKKKPVSRSAHGL